jgi:farnesyl-diphosphate farnesyltransferase
VNDDDRQFQYELLHGVARTFALTIPQLPAVLADVVANAYLLCRIADTIEDEPQIDPQKKCALAGQFINIVAGQEDAQTLTQQLYPLLSAQRPAAEKTLIQQIPRVIGITHGFSSVQREALLRCVTIMSKGMAYYQAHSSLGGMETLQQLNNYCYHVAGVVGEMLTELCCEYSPEMAAGQSELRELAVSFGQGLQMTNVLKDIWEDYSRGVCWLPRDLFMQAGFDLDHLPERHQSGKFTCGLEQLIAISRSHLQNAGSFVMLIPPEESGLRKFCLWAIGMALLTLGNIQRRPGFRSSAEIRINKVSLFTVIAISKLVHRNNFLTGLALTLWSRALPPPVSANTDTSHQVIADWFNNNKRL